MVDLETILAGLGDAFTLWNLAFVIFGVALGQVVAAIPGIGPAMAIAIAIPFTFGLDPLPAIAFLVGVCKGGTVGGAIPAILINTPGTPVNALTTYDGYAMTQRGEAGRGLSLAYSASFFGGSFSILVALSALILFGPYLRDLGALFGQRDIFMAALLGAVLLILAHRQTMVIAALLFGIGFMISLIGRQSLKRIDRYTFDFEYLYAGFNLIVVIVGIFAISQALYLLTGKDADPPEARMKGGLFRGMGELRKYKITATISAAYGTVMGIIPGVGEFVAQFFSYSTARFLSKTPTQFGHGAPEGLIASETANNAVPAAAMIPLLALGVPGEALTAMMMVVFFDAGIKPGPDIFENSSDFLFSLFIALLIVNILVVITLMFCTKYIAKMVYIPNRFLGGLILMLSFVGVFSIRNSFADCIFASLFGFFGFVLRRLDWPLVPLVLGLVLGSIMVERLTAGASQITSAADLVNRPVSGLLAGVILVIILATITAGIFRRYRRL